jgi:hypothetical protein
MHVIPLLGRLKKNHDPRLVQEKQNKKKTNKQKRQRGIAGMAEHLPKKCEMLSSIPSTTKKK